MGRVHRGLRGLVAGVVLLLAAPTPGQADEPVPEADPTAFAVTDAVLRWGVNDESNNNAFAPGTFNFPSAGKAPDPGRGGQVIDDRGRWPATGATAWRASSGNVRIEKVTSAGPVPATVAGLRTGPDGQSLGGPTVEVFSNHQVVVSGGTGQVDPEAGTATIRWEGSFTLFYYSGMSFFSVTDPVLEVTPAGARITATGTGFASSMEDPTRWSPVAPTPITLADLTGVGTQQLAAAKGFAAPTTYLGVRYDAPAGRTPQVRTGSSWGAAPRSLLAFLEKVGMAAYWYSSGGSGDRFKPTKPVTVSWDATSAIEPDPPPTVPSAPQPENPAGEAPPDQPDQPSSPAVPGAVQPSSPPLSDQLAAPSPDSAPSATDAAAPAPASYQPPVAYAVTSSPTTPERAAGSSRGLEWVLGFLLLLGAGGISAWTPLMNRLRGNR